MTTPMRMRMRMWMWMRMSLIFAGELNRGEVSAVNFKDRNNNENENDD